MKPDKPEIKKLYALSNDGHKIPFTLPLKNIIRFNGRDYRIELREDEKYGVHVLWKNRRYPVEIVRTKQNRYEILSVSYTHLRAHETVLDLVCRLLLEKK